MRVIGAGLPRTGTSSLREMLDQLAGEGFTLRVADELDTALFEIGTPSTEVLSHTQNIGRMLKTHFKHSQVKLDSS